MVPVTLEQKTLEAVRHLGIARPRDLTQLGCASSMRNVSQSVGLWCASVATFMQVRSHDIGDPADLGEAPERIGIAAMYLEVVPQSL
ncbi:MAG TPA: hypothetical protein VJ738_20035 [Steroidobacteraceae bacterium]|nr:hypothetical protein [Steroidobacteraceae bacterium]